MICGFGSAMVLKVHPGHQQQLIAFPGTPPYMPPELGLRQITTKNWTASPLVYLISDCGDLNLLTCMQNQVAGKST